nr:MAG TPA: hypothetical protein [Herelleviridae sp.]
MKLGRKTELDIVFKFLHIYIAILYKLIDFDSTEIVLSMLTSI